MHTRISPCRSHVSDRFPVASFVIKVPPTRLFEVACATDPRLFHPDNRSARTPENFYTSRASGLMRAPAGEASYLLPPEQLKRFAGNQRIYYAVATFDSPRGEDARTSVDPTQFERAPYFQLAADFTGRALDRSQLRGLRKPASATYGAVGQPLLWGGDVALTSPEPDRGYDDGYDGSLWTGVDADGADSDGIPDYARDYDEGSSANPDPELDDEPMDDALSNGWGTAGASFASAPVDEVDDGIPYGGPFLYADPADAYPESGAYPAAYGDGSNPDFDLLRVEGAGLSDEDDYPDDSYPEGSGDGYGGPGALGPHGPGLEDGCAVGSGPTFGGIEDARGLGVGSGGASPLSGWPDELPAPRASAPPPPAVDPDLFAYGEDFGSQEADDERRDPFDVAPARDRGDPDRSFGADEDDREEDDDEDYAASLAEPDENETELDGSNWDEDPAYSGALPAQPVEPQADTRIALDPLGKAGLLYAIASANRREHPFAAFAPDPDAGLRYGVAGFDQASGALGNLIARFRQDAPEVYGHVFDGVGDELIEVTTAGTRELRLAPVGGVPLSDSTWEHRFARAASERAFQKAQLKEAVDRWVDPNLAFAGRLGLDSDLGLAGLVACCQALGNPHGRGVVADALCPIRVDDIESGATERLGAVLGHLGHSDGSLIERLEGFQEHHGVAERRAFGPETQAELVRALRVDPHPDFPLHLSGADRLAAIAAHPQAPSSLSELHNTNYLTGQRYWLEG